ncbi:hypothetical protein D9M70_617730 [compost metagenome]
MARPGFNDLPAGVFAQPVCPNNAKRSDFRVDSGINKIDVLRQDLLAVALVVTDEMDPELWTRAHAGTPFTSKGPMAS